MVPAAVAEGSFASLARAQEYLQKCRCIQIVNAICLVNAKLLFDRPFIHVFSRLHDKQHSFFDATTTE